MADAVLVTGAAGFAGSHVLDLLAAEGVPAVAWRRPGGRQPAAGPGDGGSGQSPGRDGVRWMAVDMLDPAAVRAAVREVQPTAIVHCAGAAHVGRSWDRTESTFATNVRGTHHLLDALRRERLSARIVITSSAMVYRMSNRALREDDPRVPASPYGLSKLAQEMLGVRAVGDGLHVTIARAFNHAGARQDPSFAAPSFARQVAEIEAGRRSPELIVGNLDARRDLTDVRDTARAYYALLREGAAGRSYNVCSGEAITIARLLEMIVSRARVPVSIRTDPSLYRPSDIPVVLGDPERIQREIGWQRTIPLARTLDDLLDYWRRQCAFS